MKISLKRLQKLKACDEGIEWFTEHKITQLVPLIDALLNGNKFDYAQWLLSKLLTTPQKVTWAIISAELVVGIYEIRYPTDKRPRRAIQAAKGFLKGSHTFKNIIIAAKAADTATYAADTADAAYAANTAAYAAKAAAYVANAASYAADAAAYAADASYAAYAAGPIERLKVQRNICNHALHLLGEKSQLEVTK